MSANASGGASAAAANHDPFATRVLNRTLNALDTLSSIDGWLGALCLMLLTALMIAGVAVRMLSSVATWLPPDLPMAWEYSSYLMAATFTFGAAMTLRRGGHLRVKLLMSRLSPKSQRHLEAFSSLVASAFSCFFTWALVHLTLDSYRLAEKSSASDTAIWIPQAIVAFGIFLLALQFIARMLRAIIKLDVELEQPNVRPDH